MKRFSYSERDYTFGQAMLTLRNAIGLTQAGLARHLGVSRRAVGGWEIGERYPKADHLKALITLAVRASAFPAGREEEEIRAFWKEAHQKVLLDESWLFTLLSQPPALLSPESIHTSPRADGVRAALAGGPRVDWREALDVPSFYGRERELATLTGWIVQERCRVVSVLGLGGIGKSALVTSAMRQEASHFQVVIFRSLRDAPDCSALLEDCLQVLAPQLVEVGAADLQRRLSLLLEALHELRVLLVLDNLESVLEAGEAGGHLRPGYEGYARLLSRVAETAHQSCLLLTSREKPVALRALEGSQLPVRSLRLGGLEASACEQLLASHELAGSLGERARLIARYEGNPLALHIVAEIIADLFGGQITPFLAQETLVFGSISDLLNEHWGRLSILEQTLLFWLAILREPVTLQELQAALVGPLAPAQILEAVDGLRRRSLVERGQRPGSFTLQSVVLEYVTGRLVSTASQEIRQGRLALLLQHGLSQAQAKEYVRQTQERLLLTPLLDLLQGVYRGHVEVEQRMLFLLEEVRSWDQDKQGYGPANLVTLLRLLRGHLRGLDLSRLALRGMYLQGIEMQDASLSGALMQECVWTESFGGLYAVAISKSGQYWATGSQRGEVRLWREEGKILQRVWRAHTDPVWTLDFSLDGHLLASGGEDGSIKLWDVESGSLLWSGWQTQATTCLAFAPDGDLLASGGLDASVRFWDPKVGTLLQELPHPNPVWALAWSPGGHLLASGDAEGTLRLWEIGPSRPATCVQILAEHSSWVRALVFAPDGSILASASWDGSVKLWELGEDGSLRMRQTLVGHTEKVQCVAWSPDGATLASGSYDHTIRLWDGQQGSTRVVLQGHSAAVYSLAFGPNSHHLLSSSEDGTLRLWEVQRGEALRVLQGYMVSLYDLDWSPDGTELASVGADHLVSLWQVAGLGEGRPRGLLRGHERSVYGVAWHPDGGVLASSGLDNAIRLWDPATGSCLQVIGDSDHPDTLFWGLTWSPDGKRLASATMRRGVLLWEVRAGAGRWIGRGLPLWTRRLAWSPDGTRLVGGAEDGYVYVWEASDGRLLQRLAGHHGAVMSVAWSPDGSRLASGGRGQGELFVWDAQTGARLSSLHEPSEVVHALTWNPRRTGLLSGGSDGRLCWWDLRHGECVRVQQAHQGTVQALKVSPDERLLASCGDDGTIHLWELESGEHLRTLRRDRPYERLTITGIRGLTQAEIATLRALGAVEDGVL